MIKVGITGGIGSGKSTVCGLFAELGAPVYDSDRHARELMNADSSTRRAIVELLGAGVYSSGVLDRALVASKVFSDSELLASLNAIVHPAVARDFEAWAHRHSDKPYVILESAILLESGFDRLTDKTITVSAPAPLRIERVLGRGAGSASCDEKAGQDNDGTLGRGSSQKRDDITHTANITRAEVERRMANQLSDPEREARADWTIDNGGTLADLAEQVEKLDKILKQ